MARQIDTNDYNGDVKIKRRKNMYKWKPSKTKAREFAEKMNEIDDFCIKNNISQSKTSDGYYFTIDNKNYRVSNHTIDASNRHAYNEFGEKIREEYHNEIEKIYTICITASKTRIIEIYNNLKSGKKLDKRGYVIED